MNYFPIIRGKQFDLAAITELLTRQHLPTTVTPILEPVKDIPGITKATRAFSRAHETRHDLVCRLLLEKTNTVPQYHEPGYTLVCRHMRQKRVLGMTVMSTNLAFTSERTDYTVAI
ncbi:hypothetical protein AMBR_LLDLPDMO_03364 [Lactiplantibacillus plantarum]|nr:hypothetical protein AMBR_LLDLPDMO_03364 [Lactiplantibacillus plantarum]